MSFIFSSSRSNINKLPINKIKSFIKWERQSNKQVDELVYKIIKKKTGIHNYIYIGNAYTLGIQDNTVMVLQSDDNKLYLSSFSDKQGRKIRKTTTYCISEIRTALHYVPLMNELCNSDIENEHLFTIDTELTSFTAIGEGIDGETFQGYELIYTKSLSKMETIETMKKEEEIEKEIEGIEEKTKIEKEKQIQEDIEIVKTEMIEDRAFDTDPFETFND